MTVIHSVPLRVSELAMDSFGKDKGLNLLSADHHKSRHKPCTHSDSNHGIQKNVNVDSSAHPANGLTSDYFVS